MAFVVIIPMVADHSRRPDRIKKEKKMVIVSGLPTSFDEKLLDKVMRKYGPVASITYPLGKENAILGSCISLKLA